MFQLEREVVDIFKCHRPLFFTFVSDDGLTTRYSSGFWVTLMKERLEDLISDADKMLVEQRKSELGHDAGESFIEEVDSNTAAHLNEAPFEPRLKFWQRYPRAAGLLTLLLLAMIAARVYIVATMPRAEGHYSVVTAVVQSSSLSTRTQGYGVRNLTVRLLLPNGNLVSMQVDSETPHSVGATLPIRLYDDGAVGLITKR